MKQFLVVVSAFVFLAFTGCTSRQLGVESHAFAYNRIVDSLSADQNMQQMITPYKTGLDSMMSRRLGFLKTGMYKARPEGTLGNWMSDVCKAAASKSAGFSVDLAILNHGGIRLPELPKGDITLGQMYELMPFDNEIVIASVSGTTLLKLCELIVSKGGDPVSGLTIKTNKTNQEIYINGTQLNVDTMYTVATTDYLYNGGDAYTAFKESSNVYHTGQLLRDALIMSFTANVSPEYPAAEGRITLD